MKNPTALWAAAAPGGKRYQQWGSGAMGAKERGRLVGKFYAPIRGNAPSQKQDLVVRWGLFALRGTVACWKSLHCIHGDLFLSSTCKIKRFPRPLGAGVESGTKHMSVICTLDARRNRYPLNKPLNLCHI